MTKILLVGENPPYLTPGVKIEAAHFRTAQFLDALLEDGHSITLVAPQSEHVKPELSELHRKRFNYEPIDFSHRHWVHRLQQVHDTVEPQCVVAVNLDFCVYATKLRTEAPIWMDIYGDPVTIMQAATYRANSDRGLKTFMGFVRMALERGDVFSVCGTPQKHMLVGELAMLGRVNRHTFGYEFGHVILPSAGVANKSEPSDIDTEHKILKQAGVPSDAFVVLWAGGYNTWTDIDTLFAGLTHAMNTTQQIVFVSVGASTYELPDNAYERFQRLISGSPNCHRFHLLGWRPWAELSAYYRESDVGINIDGQHYETVYGTRTRLVEMISEGLPIVTSIGTELASLLTDAGAALGFTIGDAIQFGDHLIKLAEDSRLTAGLSANAVVYSNSELSVSATTGAIREWVNAPQRAPNGQGNNLSDKFSSLEYDARARMRWLLWRLTGAYR